MIFDKQFVFIIGSPRSGTTWLQTMVGAHPAVCTSVELTLFAKYIGSWISFWDQESDNIEHGRWHKGLPFLWTAREFYAFLQDFLEKVYERVLATKPHATHILDKNPSYALHLEAIDKLLPDARFIHLVRDGRDAAASMMAAQRQIGFGADTIEHAAVAWKRHVLAARKAKQYENRYLEVRYEELLASGPDMLKSVFDFCGLPASMQDVTAIVKAHQFEKMKASKMTPARSVKAPDGAYRRGKVGSWQEELRPLQRYIFDQIAGDLLSELGYAEDGWWAVSRKDELAVPTLAAVSTLVKRVLRAAAVLAGPTLAAHVKETRMVRLVLRQFEQWQV